MAILVGSHHKTGTHFINGIMKDFCKKLSIPYLNIPLIDAIYLEKPAVETYRANGGVDNAVYFNSHSLFGAINSGDFGFHLVRDPRDVCISGAMYHLGKNHKEEYWLYDKKRYSGFSYNELIIQKENFEEALLFELENMTQNTCEEMIECRLAPIKYEELFEDYKNGYKICGLIPSICGMDSPKSRLLFTHSYIENHIMCGEQSGFVRDGSVAQYLLLNPAVQKEMTKRLKKYILALGYFE